MTETAETINATPPAEIPPGLVADTVEEQRVRPLTFDAYIGQHRVVASIRIAVLAALARKEPIDHVLLNGPPGLGKTTLAGVIAHAMSGQLVTTTGPALARPSDLLSMTMRLSQNDVLFIDEIHQMPKAVEEGLYGAMEDRVLIVRQNGAGPVTHALPPFTLVAATTRPGMLSAPLRDRFGMVHHLEFYDEVALARIALRAAGILNVDLKRDAAAEIARRGRGTPRVVVRLLRRVRDWCETKKRPANLKLTRQALDQEGVDDKGLDFVDRLYLRRLCRDYMGGPVGLRTLAATINDDPKTIEETIEPFLMQIGFLTRTGGGRVATTAAKLHIAEIDSTTPVAATA